MRLSYAIILVSDMQRSVSFYRDQLGLPLRFESPGWSEFATDGATIALHLSEQPASPPEVAHAAGSCRPGLRVPDLDDFHRRMLERRLQCVQEPREVFGARLAQYLDPDGLTISVGEEPSGA